jgi:membrane-bound lytic murein transglycosylase
MHFDDST